MKIKCDKFRYAIRRRLGLAINFEGDSHRHQRLASNLDARMNARHTVLCNAWRQVLSEAGGKIPDRNVERLLSSTFVPTSPGDLRRLDLVVPGLSVHEGLPLFCDATIVTPISRNGFARPDTSNRVGRLLKEAIRTNANTYPEVTSSGLGKLLCLGAEVFGRWSSDCVELVPLLAREHSRDAHPQIRRGIMLGFQRRWWGILSVALQNSVADAVLKDVGADLPITMLEPAIGIAALPSL